MLQALDRCSVADCISLLSRSLWRRWTQQNTP